jgi:hypothetical protein
MRVGLFDLIPGVTASVASQWCRFRCLVTFVILSAMVIFPALNSPANLRDLKEDLSVSSVTRALNAGSNLTIESSRANFDANGGAGNIVLSANGAWSLQSDVDWIANFSVGSGNGSATINYSVGVNSGTSPRTGSVKILDKNSVVRQTLIVTQSGAESDYAFALDRATIFAQGGDSVAELTAPNGSAWTVQSTANWITNISPTSGVGSATITYSVLPNSDCDPRSNAIVVLNEDSVAQLWVIQSGGGGHYEISTNRLDVIAQGGSNSVYLTAGSSCSWRTRTDANWMHRSSTNGTGSNPIEFSVDANPGCSPRSAVIQILDGNSAVRESVTISQAGAPSSYTLSSTYFIFTASGGNVSVGLTANCSWTAQSDVPWISNISPASGSSDATIYFTVTANTNCPSRTGTIKIYDGNSVHRQTLSITQSGNPTSYELSPSGATFASVGGSNNVNVTASNAGCIWTTSNSNSWIQVNPVSAIGSATVTVTVSPNATTNSRTGTILIAGMPYTVTQAAAVVCTYSVAPSIRNYDAGEGNGTVTVGASSSECGWTASSAASWITITSGASGMNSGTVYYSVAANTKTNSRSTTLTVAGKTFTISQAGMPDSARDSESLAATKTEDTDLQLAVTQATETNTSITYIAHEALGLAAMDLSDSVNPVLLGSSDLAFNGFDVAISGATACAVGRQDFYSESGALMTVSVFYVLDLSDAMNPKVIGKIANSEAAFVEVAVSGDHAFVKDELGAIKVIDFSDPENPALVVVE